MSTETDVRRAAARGKNRNVRVSLATSEPDRVRAAPRIEPRAAAGAMTDRIRTLEESVRALQRRETLLLQVLDRLPVGVVVVDRDGKPIAANRYANEILEEADGLSVCADGLRTDRTEETIQLRQCLSETTGAERDRDRRRGRVLSVQRSSEKRALSLVVTPLHVRGVKGLDEPRQSGCAAVFVADPERNFELSHERLRRLYGLTRAEGQIAASLADGKRLDEAAADLGITLNTARSHLKRIFFKTSTERQGELTHLLQSLLGKIRLD